MLTPIEHIITNMLAERDGRVDLERLLWEVMNAGIKVDKQEVEEALNNLINQQVVVKSPGALDPGTMFYGFNHTKVKLYNVTTTTTRYPGFEGYELTINWWVKRDKPAYPLRNILTPEGLADDYTQLGVAELFTADEALQLADCVINLGVTKITPVELPIAEYFPFGAIPVGGGPENYMLSESDDYELPFKVWGFYDKRQVYDQMDTQKQKPESPTLEPPPLDIPWD